MKKIVSLILIGVMLFGLATLTGCKNKDNYVYEPDKYPTELPDSMDGFIYVEMVIKGHGRILLGLDPVAAPKTVANFVKLVNEGYYNGLTFHRVVSGFMIQGGDPSGEGYGDPNAERIEGEFSANGYYGNYIKHKRGVISMARSTAYNSASTQFFIMLEENSNLNGQYAAFGYVVKGMNTVDAILLDTIEYATSSDGVIPNKKKQAVIKSAYVLENYVYTPETSEK